MDSNLILILVNKSFMDFFGFNKFTIKIVHNLLRECRDGH